MILIILNVHFYFIEIFKKESSTHMNQRFFESKKKPQKTFAIYFYSDHFSKKKKVFTYQEWSDLKNKGAFNNIYYWFDHCLSLDLSWKEDKNLFKIKTFCNYQNLSEIKYNVSNMEKFHIKHMLYTILRGKKYSLDFLTFNLNNPESLQELFSLPMDDSLWFVKKSAITTFGGYDVFPIFLDSDFKDNLQKCIEESNKNEKYRSDVFVLQKGVSDLYLWKDCKFDLRVYFLVVGSKRKINFYVNNFFLMRKAQSKYSENSVNRSVQLTNTTFNKTGIKNAKDLDNLTEILGPDTNHPLTDICWQQLLPILNDIAKVYSPIFDKDISKFFYLFGLDFIMNHLKKLFILEANRTPAIYKTEGEIVYLHKLIEQNLFHGFVDLTLNAIFDGKLINHDFADYTLVYEYDRN
jgi:hypothetical protein